MRTDDLICHNLIKATMFDVGERINEEAITVVV